MPFEFGDVVIVRFPFTNQKGYKQRPAVVVSNRAYNQARPDVVIMAITSQMNEAAEPGWLSLFDWQAANLLRPSAVKPLFATVEQELIARSLGRLQAVDAAALREAIAKVLA